MIRNKDRVRPDSLLDRILVPLDGSDLAETILPKIRGLLRRADAEVILVQASADTGSTEYLKATASKLEAQGVRVRTRTVLGPAAETILSVAFEEQASLIAMSTHGRSGIARWTLGSIAEKVIRASNAPVLVVRAFAKGELDVKRILVPIDASGNAARILKPANELARLFQATASLLYVQPVIMAFPVGVMIGDSSAPPMIPVDCEPPDLELFRARMSEGGVEVRANVTKGDPALAILEEAQRQDADIIAMTTHGFSGVMRWMLGSTTEKVLRHGDRPMLIVRSTP